MKRPPKVLQGIRSALFNFGMYGATAILAIVGLPLLVLPARFTVAFSRLWAQVVLALLALTCGLRHQVRGQENLPDGPLIVACKHQSTWETLSLAVLVKQPAFVIKRDLMCIPIFGWYLARARSIAVDRRGRASALRRMLKSARAIVDQGRPIVIFPEGTRAKLGASLPYQPGIAAVYSQLNLPVVPVALNSGVFWGRRTFVKWPGTITVEFLPAIPPGLKRDEFMQTLRQRIDSATDRLVAEAQAEIRS
ncbi:MAG: lysophospholipid acyltransferase family protein [Rhodospirillales bacterium]